MLHIIWGSIPNFKPRDQLPKPFILEGSLRAYLTDPQMYPPSLSPTANKNIQSWKVSRTFNILKNRRTSYWCDIKKAPSLSTVHHIIGVKSYA